MTEQELHAAQDAAFIEYFHSVERKQLRDKSKGCTLSLRTAEQLAFRKGWAAADAFADEYSEPEQLDHNPDATKMMREQAAIAAMQGLIVHKETFRDAPFNDIPKMAVIMADALLAELDKTNNL